MPGVVRLGDNCSGHGCYPSRPNIQASGNVFTNNIGTHRKTDAWAEHCCPKVVEDEDGEESTVLVCHDGKGVGGSNVYVNGLAIQKIGDPVDCGSTQAEGSGNVFANG